MANNLLEEYSDPMDAASDVALEEIFTFLGDRLIDISPIGRFKDVLSLSEAVVAFVDTDGYSKLAARAKITMINALLNIGFVSEREMEYAILDLWESLKNNTANLDQIELLRECVNLNLRTTLRNQCFVYYLNEELNEDDNWFMSSEASDILDKIAWIYARLLELENTQANDKLLLVAADLEDMYNDAYVFKREKLDYSVVTEAVSVDNNETTCVQKSSERDIVLVLDNSGSMSGTPIQETKKASEKFIETILKEDASIGIVKYESSADMISNFSMDENQLKGALDELYASGGTNILSGLTLANEMLQQSNAKKQIIVLMSDGLPSNSHDELINYAEELRKKGIIIYTLGFFEAVGSYNKVSTQSLMEGMASEGCHYEVADADSLVYFFGDVADQISGQKYIYIRIACPVDVTVKYRGETLCSDVDDLSTRTSFGSLTFEENTENSDGNSTKDDRVKILRLKEGTEYDIHIEGTGRGRMNYTIGFMDEDGEYSDLRKFRNIPITRSTVIDTIAVPDSVTVLNVDEDGDGKYDLKYKADENSRGELVDNTPIVVAIIVSGTVLALTAIVVLIVLVKRGKIKFKIKRKV